MRGTVSAACTLRALTGVGNVRIHLDEINFGGRPRCSKHLTVSAEHLPGLCTVVPTDGTEVN